MIPADTQPPQVLARELSAARERSTAGAAGRERPTKPIPWRERLARYEQADRGRALLDLATSALPYLALSALLLALTAFWVRRRIT